MANVDDRVVAMSFEYSKFSAGVSITLGLLGKLSAAIKNVGSGSTSGFDNIERSANRVQLTGISGAIDKLKQKLNFGSQAANAFSEVEKDADRVTLSGANRAVDNLKQKLTFPEGASAFAAIERESGRINLSGLSSALDNVRNKFSVLQGAAAVALGNIASRAAMAGGRVIKSMTLDPLVAGFHNYETQINAVQTILANTGLTGAKGMGKVNKALADLNEYANKTVYNFSEMAKNIGTFTAAGVDLDTATGSIKGIANLAAMSGSTSQQASTAMYQLSQAIAAGKVGLQDWNSVVNAGMGGSVFQKALAHTAEAMGTLHKGSVQVVGPMKQLKIEGESFRNAIQAKPGKQSWLTSDVLTTTLKEFTGDMSKAQLASIGFSQEQVKAIQSQATMAVKAATNIKTMTQMTEALKEEVGTAWATVFKTIFGNITGATSLFTGLHNVLQNALTNPIYHLNKILNEWVKLGGRKDFFAGIKAGWNDLRAVLKPIREAFRDIFPAATGKSLAEASKNFRILMDHLKMGPDTADKLRRTFRGLFAILDIGKQIVGGILHVIGSLFGAVGKGSGDILGFTGHIGDLIVAFDNWLKKGHFIIDFVDTLGKIIQEPIKWLGHLVSSLGGATQAVQGSAAVSTATGAWEGFLNILDRVGQALGPALDSVIDVFRKAGDLIIQAIQGNNWDKIFQIIQTTLIGGLFLAVKNALGGGINIDLGGSALRNVSKSMDVLRGSLTQLQGAIKAATMMEIAAAVALLAGAVLLLSLVPADKLKSALEGIAFSFGQLLAAMAILTKIDVRSGFKLGAIAGGMILLAIAVDLLTIGVTRLSKLNWTQLAKGLAGVGVLLLELSGATALMRSAGGRMALVGAAMIPLALALDMLVFAVKQFGGMNTSSLAKGLAAIAIAMVAIGDGVRAFPKDVIIIAPAMILLSVALAILAGAVKLFGMMDLATLAKGILGIGAALGVIGIALRSMPVGLPLIGAGLVLVGVGLDSVAASVALMGHMSVATLGKGIIAIGASLAVLAVGLDMMVGALPGAAALLVVSAALLLFGPALAIMGSLSFGTVAKGLIFIGASLIAIGAAGTIAAPMLAILGAALVTVGIGTAAVGAGLYLIAKAVEILANKGVKGVTVFLAALTALIVALPGMIISFLKGVVEILSTLASLAPKIVASLVTIVGQLLAGLIKLAPKIAIAATSLITAFLKVLAENAGPIIEAGFQLFLKLLQGLSGHIGQIVTSAVNIVTRFLNALAGRMPSIMRAGANFIIAFVTGIGNNAFRVVNAAANAAIKFVEGVARKVPALIGAGADLIIKFIEGVGRAGWRIVRAAVSTAGLFIERLGKELPKLADSGALAIINFINGIAKAIRTHAKELWKAGFNLAWSILQGLGEGIKLLADKIYHLIPGPLRDAIDVAKSVLDIGSPSGVFRDIGQAIGDGFTIGLEDSAGKVYNATERMVQHIGRVGDRSSQVATSVQKHSTSIGTAITTALDQVSQNKDLEWRITPVVDLTNVKDAHKWMNRNVTGLQPAIAVPASPIRQEELSTKHQAPATAPSFKFEQNNYSPEALSEREIYRRTHNQLSQVKSALKI